MPEHIVDDPIVPIEIQLSGGSRVTLYQPGWGAAEDGAEPFLGAKHRVYVFRDLAALAAYVSSEASHDLSTSPTYPTVREWSVDDLAERLCVYDLSAPPSIAESEMGEDEQSELGSLLGVVLDLIDYTQIEDEHAEALQNDAVVEALAGGETVSELATDEARRGALADLVNTHLPWCVAAFTARVVVPDQPGATTANFSAKPAAASGDADGPRALEEVTDAVTLWFAFAKDGLYIVRTTTVHDAAPAYATSASSSGPRALLAAQEPETLQTAASNGRVALGDVDLSQVAQRDDVSFTPSDECIFDLVEIGESIGPAMTVEQADALVSAWTELVRLGRWGSWTDVQRPLGVDEPIGAFVTGCAIDLAQSRPGAERALATADTDAAGTAWGTLVSTLRERVEVLEDA